jgi:hypothetical protein
LYRGGVGVASQSGQHSAGAERRHLVKRSGSNDNIINK